VKRKSIYVSIKGAAELGEELGAEGSDMKRMQIEGWDSPII